MQKKLIILYLFVWFAGTAVSHPAFDCSPEKGTKESFAQFLAGFKPWQEKTFRNEIFGDTVFLNPFMDDGSLPYLPREIVFGNARPDQLLWQKGSFVKRKHCVWAFMQCAYQADDQCEFMSTVHHILVVYANDGRIIDAKTIGTRSHLAYFHLSGDLNKGQFCIKQGLVKDTAQFYDYGNLLFSVQAYKGKIAANGHVSMIKTGQPWEEYMVRDEDLHEPVDFQDFTALFPDWTCPTVNDSVFTTTDRTDTDIPSKYVMAYLSDFIGHDSRGKRTLVWKACHRLKAEKHTLLFITKSCDEPVAPGYPYTMQLMLVFDNDGRLAGQAALGKTGDLWRSRLSGTTRPFSVELRQWESADANIPVDDLVQKQQSVVRHYTIDAEGKVLVHQ